MQRWWFGWVSGTAAFLVACSGGGEPGQKPSPAAFSTATALTSPSPQSVQATPSSVATPPPKLTGMEILQRSVEAMRTVTAIYESRLYPRSGGSEDGAVFDFHEGQVRSMLPDYASLPSCQFRDYDFALGRTTGGAYGRIGRGTAPDSIELLGTVDYEGVTAWNIRYRFTSPSIEGPFPVERTEWIDAETFHVLRTEREQVDPFGFIGQVVEVARSFDEETPCPSEFEVPLAKFAPVTVPRIDHPAAPLETR